MGILGKAVGAIGRVANVGGGVKDATGATGDLAIKVRQAVTGELSPADKADLAKMEQQAEVDIAKGQIEVNKIEAQSSSLFVSGWRPAVGWVCVLGLFQNFIVNPNLEWAAKLVGNTITAPAMDASTLMTLVLTLLGLGGFRTYERTKGVARR